jgi:ureidoacrylate peracid hydrolase
LRRKRGRRHPFLKVVGPRTAHIVVDLQSAFLTPGSPLEIPTAREIVPNVNCISKALRAANGLVIYLQHTVDDNDLEGWSVYYRGIVGPSRCAMLASQLRIDASGHALWPELNVTSDDWVVRKHRFGAFMPCSSDLHERLRSRGIDTVVISGTATNCCCESTAREAMSLNYKVFVIEDATATDTDAEHNASLSMLLNTFADVRSTRSMVKLIDASDRVVEKVSAE